MQRFLTSLALVGLLFSVTLSFVPSAVVPLARAEFSDVTTADWHYAAISSLVEQGVLEGYEDGTFRPESMVNRAEALKMILIGMGIAVGTGAEGENIGAANESSEVAMADGVGMDEARAWTKLPLGK